MAQLSYDAAHLRSLAAKCRSAADIMGDRADAASLRKLAAEYDAEANRIDQPDMANPASRMQL